LRAFAGGASTCSEGGEPAVAPRAADTADGRSGEPKNGSTRNAFITDVNPRRIGSGLLTLLLAVLLGSLVLGSLLGQPVLLGFVETGSMSPTLEPDDGFIAVPAALSDDVERGDVIVFDARQLNGGGLTTHRVVGVTENGYITKGDANLVTDQDGDEPPVTQGQIKAEALQVGGDVVVVPGLGAAVTGTRDTVSWAQRQLAIVTGSRSLLGAQGLAYLLFGTGVLLYVVSTLFSRGNERSPRERTRDDGTVDYRLVLVGLTVLLIAVATAGMTLGGGTQEFGMVSSETDSERLDVVPTGENETITYRVPGGGMLPAVVFLEPESTRIDVEPAELYIGSGGQENATVTLRAPETTGSFPQYLTEYRYPGVLPRETIRTLYHVHPWAPIVVIDTLLGIGFLTFGAALLGTGPIRIRSRESPSVLSRLRQWFR
jgi:signal peptidase